MSEQASRRPVVVSAVGVVPPAYPGPGRSEDRLVDAMVAFWRSEIEAVLPDRPDLILLPELCDRYEGIDPAARIALQPAMQAAMRPALAELARSASCYLGYASAMPDADGIWRNAVTVIDRSGVEAGSYAKNWLVVTETEFGLVPGRGPAVIETDFGRIGAAICFDLNFLELLEGYRPLQPDLMIFPSRYHGGMMQPYWAYQLRSHFVASVGVGNLTSDVWSPVGRRIAASTNYAPTVTTMINTNCAVVHLDFNRPGLKALKRARGRAVTITDPGELGAVMITGEDPAVPVAGLLAEYEIEPLDAYFERSRHHNDRHRR